MSTLYRFPLGRPQRASVKEIYDLHEAGLSVREIAQSLYSRVRSCGAWDAKGQVRKYLDDPALYDPYIDEVALSRALKFEQSVIENLTVFEWAEFCDRLLARQLPGPDGDDRERLAWMGLPESLRTLVQKGIASAHQRRTRREKAA